MQVLIETTSGLERRLTVGVPAERVESAVNQRLQQAAQSVRLRGFRPGKVPMKVIRQRFGAGVRQEVLGEVMSQSFYEAITQERLRPAGQPSIQPKTIVAGKDLEFIATFEVFPEVEPVSLKNLKVVRPQAEVTDTDVDNMVEIFRKQQGEWTVVERAAQVGDRVNIDYAGTRDGEPFEGGAAEGADLELGSGRMIPGFEAGIEGLRAGEEKTLELTFPEDYQAEDLRGAAVQFAVKLNEVRELIPAEMNDEFFGKYGVVEGGEERFRKDIADNMARELKNAVRNAVKRQIMDAVQQAHSTLDVPKALILQEINALRQQMLQQFGGNLGDNLDLEQLLPADMFRERALTRVRLGLVLSEYVQREKLKADPARVREAVEEIASTYEDPEEVVEWYYANQEQLSSIESVVLEDQLVDKFLGEAEVADEPCSYQDALARGQASS